MKQFITEALRCCVPVKSIYFALDGPGPLAKLETQRNRRQKHRTDTGKHGRQTLDRLQLTPGVDLMYHVRDAVEQFSRTLLVKDNTPSGLQIHISGADVAGEGEMKIIDYCHVAGFESDDSICIVGGDADIFLLGLATTTVKNMFVFLHRTTLGVKRGKVQNLVLSVWEFTRSLELLFPGESFSVRIDFILLAILRGNDYLPKLRGADMSNLWRRYCLLKKGETKGKRKRLMKQNQPHFQGKHLVDACNRTLNWSFLCELLSTFNTIFSSENETKKTPAKTNDCTHGNTVPTPAPADDKASPSEPHQINLVTKSTNNEGDYQADKNDVQVDGTDGDRGSGDGNVVIDYEDSVKVMADDDNCEEIDDNFTEEAETANGMPTTNVRMSKVCKNESYCRCLLWILQMYIDGYCSDYWFCYTGQCSPTARTLKEFISKSNDDFLQTIQAPMSTIPPLRPDLLASALLPRRAIHLLPAIHQGVIRQLPEDANVVDIIQAVGSVVPNNAGVIVVGNEKNVNYTYANDIPAMAGRGLGNLRDKTTFGMPFMLGIDQRIQQAQPYNNHYNARNCNNNWKRTAVYKTMSVYSTASPSIAWPNLTPDNVVNQNYLRVRFRKEKPGFTAPPSESHQRNKIPVDKNNSHTVQEGNNQRKRSRDKHNVVADKGCKRQRTSG